MLQHNYGRSRCTRSQGHFALLSINGATGANREHLIGDDSGSRHQQLSRTSCPLPLALWEDGIPTRIPHGRCTSMFSKAPEILFFKRTSGVHVSTERATWSLLPWTRPGMRQCCHGSDYGGLQCARVQLVRYVGKSRGSNVPSYQKRLQNIGLQILIFPVNKNRNIRILGLLKSVMEITDIVFFFLNRHGREILFFFFSRDVPFLLRLCSCHFMIHC